MKDEINESTFKMTFMALKGEQKNEGEGEEMFKAA